MKLFFDRSDSFYKIFKSIEKIPDGKTITIEIHPYNQFFKNIRRGKQLLELLKEKKISYSVLTNSDFVTSYFQELWEVPVVNKDNKLKNFVQAVYNFFFNIKSFHLQMLSKKDYLSFVVLALESLIVLIAIYIFWVILVPTAVVAIKPSFNIEEVAYNFRYYPIETPLAGEDLKFISIPYYKSSIENESNFSVPVSNIVDTVINAKGFVKFTNNLGASLTLKPSTKLVTKDGILLATLDWVTVPAKGNVVVPAEALDRDDKNDIIWNRGNIAAGTTLVVKNLQWTVKSNILVSATVNFTGGKNFSEWVIVQADLDNFKVKAKEQLNKVKRDIIMKQVKTETLKPLLFDDMIEGELGEIKFNKNIGEVASVLDGSLKQKIVFRYIRWDELMSAVYKFTSQRSNQSFSLVEIDRNSAVLYDRFVSSTGIYIIPTKINTIRGYNFSTDIAWLKSQIKQKISGMTKEAAAQSLLTFSNIGAAEIKISPFWIHKIPNVMSRIKIELVK